MAVAERLPQISQDLGSLDALFSFINTVHEIESVVRVASSRGVAGIDIWVFMAEEMLADARRVYLAEYDFRRAVGAVPIDVHVLPLSEIDPESVPEAKTLFERR